MAGLMVSPIHGWSYGKYLGPLSLSYLTLSILAVPPLTIYPSFMCKYIVAGNIYISKLHIIYQGKQEHIYDIYMLFMPMPVIAIVFYFYIYLNVLECLN